MKSRTHKGIRNRKSVLLTAVLWRTTRRFMAGLVAMSLVSSWAYGFLPLPEKLGKLTLETPEAMASGWYSSSWLYRKTITIDHTKVASSTSTGLTDFPVLVNLTDADLLARAQSDGDDILFTSSDGTTKLSHEIEKYSSTTGELFAWVKVPTLATSTDTSIYMYYGNAATSSEQNVTGVWNSNYKSVWHMKENPASNGTAIDDATSNSLDSSLVTNNTTNNKSITGKVDGGITFDDSGDYINRADNDALSFNGSGVDLPYSVSGWFYLQDVTETAGLVTKWSDCNNNEWIFYIGSNKLLIENYDNSGCDAIGRSVALTSGAHQNRWMYLAATYSGVGDATGFKIYIDGVRADTTTSSVGTYAGIQNSTAPVQVGAYANGGNTLNGNVDDVRILGTELSADWIATEYANQSATSTFYTVGSQKTNSSIEQEGFRWRADDGSESGATWLAAQDTNITQPASTNTRLRMIVNATGDPLSTQYQLEYKKNAGSYTKVPVAESTPSLAGAVETSDVTESGNNTASTSWGVSTPAAAAGDLIIVNLAWDDSTNTTDVTAPTGMNGETAVVVESALPSSNTAVRGKVFRYISTGTWAAGTLTFTPSASEQWTASVIRVPAGEFDPTTPIGAHNHLASTATGNPSLPSLTAGATDGDGRVVGWLSSDTDNADGTVSGWSSISDVDRGAVGGNAWVRSTLATNSESISAASGWTYPAAHDWVSFIYIIRPPADIPNELYIATSSSITASGENTTAQLTAPSSKTTSNFSNGRIQDDENPTDAVDIASDGYTELEWNLFASSTASVGDVYQFRVTDNGALLDTYTVTPQWTIGSSGTALSGTAYQSEGGAALTSKTVKVYKNGTTLLGSATTNGSGAWSMTTNAALSSGDIITAYIDGDAVDATTVFVSDGTAQTNIDLYGDALIVRQDTGSSITNANLHTAAIYGETDMIYSTSTSNAITLSSGAELHVWTGDTYAPGGTITTQGTGDVHVDNNATATLGTSGNTIGDDITVDTGATLTINANTTVSGGGMVTSGTGVITTTSGTPTVTLAGTGSIGGGSAALVFYNLTASGSGTITADSTVTINNNFTAGSKTWNFTTSGTPFTIGGTFAANTSTISFQANAALTLPDLGYYNLDLSPSSGSRTYSPGGISLRVDNDLILGGSGNITLDLDTGDNAATVGGSVTIGSGDTFAASGAETLSIGGGFANSGTFTHNNGTVAFTSSASKTLTGGMTESSAFYDLVFNGSGSWAPDSDIDVDGDLTVATGTLDLNTSDPAVTVSGNVTISDSGTLSAASSDSLTIGGDFTNNATFTHNNGTVVANPSGSTATFDGTTALVFYNFTASAANKTIRFAADQNTEIANTLTLAGSVSNPLIIRSTSAGSQWLLKLSGAASVSFVHLSDSGCAASTNSVTLPGNAIDGGNNGACWIFVKHGTVFGHGLVSGPVEGGSGGGVLQSGGGQSGGSASSTPPVESGSGGGTSIGGGSSGGGGGEAAP